MRAAFADQFQPDGADFLYRRNLRGPAYPVSATERDAFVADFSRSYRRLFWAMTGGTVTAILAISAISIGIGISIDHASSWLFAGIITLLIAPFYLAMRRIYYAPSRALERHAPVSAALSKDASRSLSLSRLSWGNLVIGTAFFLFLPFQMSGRHLLEDRNRAWLLFGAAGLALCAVQAFRKWRFEREG